MMLMKFAKICYGRQNTSSSVLWDNLPEFLRELYYLKVYRPVYKEAELFSAEGIILKLPFYFNEKNSALLEKYIQKEFCRLKEEGVEFFSVQHFHIQRRNSSKRIVLFCMLCH